MNGLKIFFKDIKSYLFQNKEKEFSVGGLYYSDSGEKDFLIDFFSQKTKITVSISQIFEEAGRLYGLSSGFVENLVFYIDDCFDDEVVVSGKQILYKVRNYSPLVNPV